MNTFSFQTAFKEAFSFTFSNIGVLLKSTLPIIIVYGLIEYFIVSVITPDAINDLIESFKNGAGLVGNHNFIGAFVGALIQVMLMIMFTVAWGGYYLKEIKNISFADVSSWHNVKTACLIVFLKVFLIYFVLVFVLSIFINAFYSGGIIGGLILIIIAIFMTGFFTRLLVMFGYSITTAKTDLSHVWNLTKNNGVKLTLSYFGLVIPIAVVSWIILSSVMFFPKIAVIVNSILTFIVYAIITVYHVNIYKQLAK